MTERLDRLFNLGLRFNGDSYVKDDFNVHNSEILCSTDEQFNTIVSNIVQEMQRRDKPVTADKIETWYFTFGMGQPNANCFIKFEGTFTETRKQMVNRFGAVWGFQYNEQEWNKSGVSEQERWGLKEIL